MTNPVAIVGQLVDAKNIAVHKSMRLSIDVPAERGAEIVKLFGWPTMAAPVPVAVARLAEAPQIEATPEPPPAANGHGKRPWRELSAPQQAGIRCDDPKFWQFLREEGEGDITNAGEAANYVRLACGVKSRAQIPTTRGAAILWRDIDVRFENWQKGIGP